MTVVPFCLLAAVIVVLSLVGFPLVGAIVIAVAFVLVGVALFYSSSEVLLRRLPTGPAEETEHPRLHNVVEGICLASGLSKPELRLLADPAANAISFGRGTEDAVLVFTTGLLDLLDRIELEAVVGHELAHMRRRDTLSGSVSAVTLGTLALVISPLSRYTVRAAGAGRESLADRASAMLTRYPPGMASALEKLSVAEPRPASIGRSMLARTGHLWLVPLVPEEETGRDAITGMLSLAERIDLLREL